MSTTPVRIATITMSDTRTKENDEGGGTLRDLLKRAGFDVVSHTILREEPHLLNALVKEICDRSAADAIVITGGTGIAPRDRTIEVLEPMFQKKLDGFGEAFRRMSFDQVGPNAILSRAAAGVIGGLIVIALPGSPKAVELATTQLIAPMLKHAVALVSGRATHHEQKHAGHHRTHGGSAQSEPHAHEGDHVKTKEST